MRVNKRNAPATDPNRQSVLVNGCVDLADVYLQRALERGYERTDRNKALRLARKALELQPGSPRAAQPS